jgi:hypothetical protein
VLCIPRPERNAAVAEGLSKLGAYVRQLEADAAVLHANGRGQAAALLDVFSGEQAASFAILLDLVRAGWDAEAPLINEQIKRFSQHLARGLYVQAYNGCPETLAEIEGYLRPYRVSLYLDGPTEVDFIFRNDILQQREGPLYVDYVAYENHCEWESPLDLEQPFRTSPKVVKLAISLLNVGICDPDALDRLRAIWRPIDISDKSLHWQTVRRANLGLLDWLQTQGRPCTAEDRKRVLDDWIHPLNFLDLTQIEVSKAELIADRERWLASQEWP